VTNPIVAGGLPGITIDTYFGGSGLGRIGSPDFLPKFQHTNQFEFIDTVSWLHGNHALKAGADFIMPMQNRFMDVPATRGALRFRTSFTGNPMADYLLGYVSDLQLSNVFVVEQRHQAQMFFVQDDWKVNARLSLNLGLRYDYMTPALESNNAQTNFIPSGTGSLVFATDGSQAIRHFNNGWSLIVCHALCIGPEFESPSVDVRFVRSTLPDSVLRRYAGLLMRYLEVRAALDNVSSNVMVADPHFKIIYTNSAVRAMLNEAESDIRKDLPQFSSANVMGSSIDVLSKNPSADRAFVITGRLRPQADAGCSTKLAV